ncbi:MAG: DUF2065 family protein [Candidatus Zeuxoniibacter abyssi]|nr:MAG: DUF2065 family protein [Candidatus Persebacteraceae bacterium AB1(2)]
MTEWMLGILLMRWRFFLVEGLGALFMPDKWWRHLQKEIAEIKTGQLRFIGFILCIGGLLIFLAAN